MIIIVIFIIFIIMIIIIIIAFIILFSFAVIVLLLLILYQLLLLIIADTIFVPKNISATIGEHENNQFVIYYSVSAKLMKKCSFKGKQIIKMEECGMDADDWRQILLLSSFWDV